MRRSTLRSAAVAAALVLTASGPAGASRSTGGLSPSPAPGGASLYGEQASFDQPVRMADGTVLRADVYTPAEPGTGRAAAGRFPVLLQQTPYGKEAIARAGALVGTDIPYLVGHGFIVVLADVRGTGSSGGTWGVFDPVQATDGATLVRWTAHLPHSDGRVGLFGESYMGINEFLTVHAAGPHSPVQAIFPMVAAHDTYSDAIAGGGIPDAEFSAAYLGLMGGLNAASPVLEPLSNLQTTRDPAGAASGLAAGAGVEGVHSGALLSLDAPLVLGVEGGGPQAFDGRYWAARSPASYLADLVADGIPAYLVGGWFDLFQQGAPLNYTTLQNLYFHRPAAAPVRPGQAVTARYQLQMGPWMHLTAGSGVDESAIEVEWFDTWLRDLDTPMAHTATPLHLYQLGANRWVEGAAWPPAGPVRRYYLAPAQGPSGGRLTSTAPLTPTGSDPISWTPTSSPCDLQSDQWSAGAFSFGGSYLGLTDPCAADDSSLGSGPGALTYTTPPFPRAATVAGPIDATIFATANTTDTELVATVEGVSPDGASHPLTSGALLGSLRAVDPATSWPGGDGWLLPAHPYTAASVRPVTPGSVTRYDISVFPTYAQVPAGWRLRLTLTTADTPHLVPTVLQVSHLGGGLYQVQRSRAAASYLQVVLADN